MLPGDGESDGESQHAPPPVTQPPPPTPKEEEEETKWGPAPAVVEEKDRRMIMGKVIELAILAVMNNHYYQFGGRYFKQGTGGAIGLRLTGLVCRIVMEDG